MRLLIVGVLIMLTTSGCVPNIQGALRGAQMGMMQADQAQMRDEQRRLQRAQLEYYQQENLRRRY